MIKRSECSCECHDPHSNVLHFMPCCYEDALDGDREAQEAQAQHEADQRDEQWKRDFKRKLLDIGIDESLAQQATDAVVVDFEIDPEDAASDEAFYMGGG